MDEKTQKTALITGANAGIGFALAERLLQKNPNIHICLACRNESRGQQAVEKLKESHPTADLNLVILDTSCVRSVHRAAQDITDRYDHIDYLYLNAGVMTVTGVDWSYFWKGVFSSRVFFMLATGEGLLMQKDETTDDGLRNVFQTNLFGHYLLVKQLDSVLGFTLPDKARQRSQIIWTSSSNAFRENYNIEDVEHKKGKDPYSSSKFGMDVLSVGLNNSLNKKNIYSHSVCPGTVMTNLTYGILPVWFWTLLFPLIFFLRLFVPNWTYSTSNGAEALVWLASQDPVKLDPLTKFQSLCSITGRTYVGCGKMKIMPEEGEELIEKLDDIERSLSRQHKYLIKHSSGQL